MKGLFTNYNGGQPPRPRSLAHYRPKYKENKEKAAHKSTAIILRSPSRRSGLLSSVALSSGRINIKNIIKFILQVSINEINRLQENENGNFNCRYREKIIVVDQLCSFYWPVFKIRNSSGQVANQ